MKFYLYEKGGGGVLAMLEGHKKFLGSFYVASSSFSHIEREVRNVLPCIEAEVQRVLDPRFFHFAAPLPILTTPNTCSHCVMALRVPFQCPFNFNVC